MGSRLHTFLCSLLVVIGLFQAGVYLFGTFPLRMLAMATVASPLPTVFSSIGDKHTYRRRFSLEIGPGKGKVVKIEGGPGIWDRFDAPFAYKGALMLAIAHANTTPTYLRRAVWDYAFCNSRTLLNGLGIKGKPKLVIVHSWDAYEGESNAMAISHTCKEQS